MGLAQFWYILLTKLKPAINAVLMDTQALITFFCRFPELASLSEEEFRFLAKKSYFKTIPKNELIYRPEQSATHVFLLLNGCVKVGIYASDGREIIKSIQYPLTIFGEQAIAGEKKRIEFAAAMNRDVELCIVRSEDMRALLHANNRLADAMLKTISARLRKAERQWESLILKDVRARIVDFIKENADEHGRPVGYETLVKHGLTQKDIANLVGASRQTVTSILNELRKSNLIYFNRNSFLIRDLNKLN